MPSLIAWLDASTDDQRRMREIIQLFAMRDSRDELGLGQVRDALSEGLFPGTTVLLTRARYLLFVPWCFQLAEGRRDPVTQAERNERTLITALQRSASDDLAGLLGARVGDALQNLPSTIYWTALRRYDIVGPEYGWITEVFQRPGEPVAGDDAPAAGGTAWSSTMPDPPADFPSAVADGFSLTQAEAGWLHDRILGAVPGCMLARLLERRPERSSRLPWLDPAVLSVDGPAADLLRIAELFSRALHGAALLYNLLLAEEYEARVPMERRRFAAPVDQYRRALADWAAESGARLAGWDVQELWSWVLGTAGAEVAPGSRQFIDDWAALIVGVQLDRIADLAEARELIRKRERRQKGAQARLGNVKRLTSWSGAAGAAPMAFRWTTVRNIVIDIHDGLDRDA